jgi:hypothetical protein
MHKLEQQAAEPRKPLIDFDQWSALAKSDPVAFELQRARFIEDTISAMPVHKQQRMRCLQWKIDQVRNQARTPMAACVKLSEMMWESLTGPGGLNEALERLRGGHYESPARAPVLRFPPRS